MASCVEHGEWPLKYLACPKCFQDGDPSRPIKRGDQEKLLELASRFAPGCIRPRDTLQMEPFTHAELSAIHDALLVAAAPASARSETLHWIPVGERLPEVPLGDEERFWVCAHRKHNGKRYVYPLWWVNKPSIDPRTNEAADWALDSEFDGALDAIGWHEIGPSESFDEFYKGADDANEIIAWMPMQKPEPMK